MNHTVRDLIESGDSILALSGIFSGTLSAVLQFDGTVPFTDTVDQAWQQGLTEPDPRVDLAGKDVMRKLVIWRVKPATTLSRVRYALSLWCLRAARKGPLITSSRTVTS